MFVCLCTASANPGNRIPDTFGRIERDYFCVNGRTQTSQGKGERDHKINYRGCLARIYMKVKQVMEDGKPQWRAVVHSEVSGCSNDFRISQFIR